MCLKSFYWQSDYAINEYLSQLYEDLKCILHLLSLYYKTKASFMVSYVSYPKLLNNNHLIYFFKYLCEENVYKLNDILILMPFNIYKNLLISCFSTEESYINFIKFEYKIDENKGSFINIIKDFCIDQNSKIFVNMLINNSILVHIKEFISISLSTEETNGLKNSAIKCLLLLTGNERFIHMLSCMKDFLAIDFPKAILSLIHNMNDKRDIDEILYTVFKLISKVQIYSKNIYSLPSEILLCCKPKMLSLCIEKNIVEDEMYYIREKGNLCVYS
ncbi:hypothetical protein HZS_7551 [Henneguya salminicola]|nr:hypothetical protein HZS_7551 [Henneguya salminicola]